MTRATGHVFAAPAGPAAGVRAGKSTAPRAGTRTGLCAGTGPRGEQTETGGPSRPQPGRLHHRLRRFLHDRRGAYSVEAILVLPVLIWANLGTYAYFDAFDTIDSSQKAAYTVADAISRQTRPLTAADIDGMARLFAYLTHARDETGLRVSSIGYDAGADRYRVIWSHGSGGGATLDGDGLSALRGRLPSLSAGETLIVVESRLRYVPFFDMGLAPSDFRDVIVTRPRLAPQVVFAPLAP